MVCVVNVVLQFGDEGLAIMFAATSSRPVGSALV